MNILVVDDSAAMRKIVIAAIAKTELKGAKITEATDGKDALNKFYDGNYAFILSDWNMPEMDGLEFVHKVRSVDKRVKIIMITTEGSFGKFETALEEGVDELIVKPFTPEALDRKIKKLLRPG